jgi:hypothetical protein
MKPKPVLKDPFAIADCLRKHEDFMLCENKNDCSLSFEVIGGTDGPLDLGTFKTGEITVKSGLNAVKYYEEIAKSKFMALGNNLLLLLLFYYYYNYYCYYYDYDYYYYLLSQPYLCIFLFCNSF